MPSSNFNYTVELNKGLESLKQGRLRQAEHSFKYLVEKFPGAEGGHRGLAKVYFEQEDRASALRVLREGATALTKSGERSAAIGLLREAVGLDPRDFATHRRLAAALALAGDPDAAVQEYARFIRDLRDSGDVERAKNEVVYAKGQLRGVPGVTSLDEIASAPAATVEDQDEEPSKTTRFSDSGATALRPPTEDPWLTPRAQPERNVAPSPPPQIVTSADDPWAAPPPLTYTPSPARSEKLREITLENDPWATASPPTAATWPPPEIIVPEEDRPSETSTVEAPGEVTAASEPEPEPAEGPISEASEAPAISTNGEPTAEEDPKAVEAAAAQYLATRDPRAAPMALEAARHYIKEGHTDAASDLLLQLIAAGVADHDAQRLLVDVARTLGKREVAKAKCQLLVQALLLDGRNDLAEEVEALALAE
jgi:Tfp pilus assembly protein PilF